MTAAEVAQRNRADRKRDSSCAFFAERAIRAGDPVSHVSSGPGAIGLGVLSTEGTRLLLSCAHVLAPRDKRLRTAPEDNIIESPPIQHSESTANRIGVLQKFTNFRPDFVYVADAATAVLDADIALAIGEVAGERLTGVWNAPADDDDFRNRRVWRLSQSGERVGGLLAGYDAQKVHFPDGDPVEFENIVRYETQSSPGDSGGAVVDEITGKLIGLHFAGDGVKFGLLCLASIIFSKFGLKSPGVTA